MARWKPSDLEKIKHKVRQESYQVYIGIDCGVQTGFAVWMAKQKKFFALETLMIHQAMDKIKRWKEDGFSIFIRIEDARLRTWIPRQENESRERGRREGAGSVKRDASIWEGFLTDLQVPFEMVAPKNNSTKIKAEYFNKITGYEKQSSSHSRDAAMLVFGL